MNINLSGQNRAIIMSLIPVFVCLYSLFNIKAVIRSYLGMCLCEYLCINYVTWKQRFLNRKTKTSLNINVFYKNNPKKYTAKITFKNVYKLKINGMLTKIKQTYPKTIKAFFIRSLQC